LAHFFGHIYIAEGGKAIAMNLRKAIAHKMVVSGLVGCALVLTSVYAAATERAPNVLVWMLDDVGFAQISSYGGLVETPNIDRLAAQGLQFTNYHTAPICSAARASFMTGRMPHSVNIGGHATAAREFPGYNGRIPRNAGTIAENLRQAGYATLALGKWDHLPSAHASPAGPFDYWPTGQGFESFYGFLAADTDNWNPTLWQGHFPITGPQAPDYHLTEDLATRAIDYIHAQRARDPARPFFIYWATGVAHAPHHAPTEWLDYYRDRFTQGWDVARQEILQRQITLGLMPASTELARRPDEMPVWAALSEDAQRLYSRQMEAFAAATSHADQEFGRILDALEKMGELENTLVLILSDNGASAEGGPDGLYNEAEVTGAVRPDVEANMAFLDYWGGPSTYPHYAYGWAVAGNTPFRYFKQTTHEGGTRVPLILSWPSGISARGEMRSSFVHVSDLAPTILDLVSVPLAASVNNQNQVPMEGESKVALIEADKGPRAGRPQYVELYGNKGIWHEGWALVTDHRYKTWDWRTSPTFDEPWSLYDLVSDPGQNRDLAASNGERVAFMAAEFEQQVNRYQIEPIHNLRDTAAEAHERAQRDFERRQGLWVYPGKVANLPHELTPPIVNVGYTFTASLEGHKPDVTGPVFAFGGKMGGMALNIVDGRPEFIMRKLDGVSQIVTTDVGLFEGKNILELCLDKMPLDDSARAKFHLVLKVNEIAVMDEKFTFSMPRYLGLAETFGIGIDSGSTVGDHVEANTYIEAKLSDITFDFSDQSSLNPTVH
jgi:arylsulfatase